MYTINYNVTMSVVSIRFSSLPVHQRLKESAKSHETGVSSLAERLIDEGLRMETHPLIVFRSGPSGRRAVVIGGPEVSDVIGSIVGGDVPVPERKSRAMELLGLTMAQVDAALAYYAEFSEETDQEISRRSELAGLAEKAWNRQQELLES